MSRRRKKKTTSCTVLDWTDEVAKLFGVVPDDWRPPLRVRAWGGIHKSTWVARFTCPDGQVNVVRVRLARLEGVQTVVERSFNMTMKWKGAA